MLYFEMILTVSLFCLGLRAITADGMIGFFARVYTQRKFPNFGKPVILCVTCMSSFWGTIIFWGNCYLCYLSNYEVTLLLMCMWLGVIFSSAFINSVLWVYYESINTCNK